MSRRKRQNTESVEDPSWRVKTINRSCTSLHYGNCIVKNCPGRRPYYDTTTLFAVPKEPKLLSKWKEILRIPQNFVFCKTSRICYRHFEKDCIEYPKRLKKEAVPTLNLDQQKPTAAATAKDVSTSEKITTKEISSEHNQETTNINKRKANAVAEDEPPTKSLKPQSPSTNEENKIKLEENPTEQPENVNTVNTEFLKENEILLPELILKTEPEEPPVEADNDEHESDDLASEIGASTYNSDHANSDRANSARPQNFDLLERNNFDRFDHMTSAWAGILRNLTRSQQIFAEKLINDVMFEAQLESLSRNSAVVVNRDPQKEKHNGLKE